MALRLLCVAEDFSPSPRTLSAVGCRLSATKSDTFDAFVLADTLRHEHTHWRQLPLLSRATAALKAVIRDRERIILSQRSVE
ncbi:transposase [Nocardia sp. NPDC004168]|uniref:IS110 family transposase n=1 Tax=Nocardia sp. NPDC004168 TaxID=3154452 RepID=UPI0033A8363B